MALGKNVNRSHFSKENVDRAYESLKFVPAVAHLFKDEEGKYRLGGHDIKIDVKDNYKIKSDCIPFGVAIPPEKPCYEEKVEDDGTTSTYLVSDVILWTGRYPELLDAKYSKELLFNQSMEIEYTVSKPLEEDDSYEDIIDFKFDALCLLNKSDDIDKNVLPCFPSASLWTSYAIDNDKKKLDKFLKDLNFELQNYFKEKEEVMKDKTLILKKYNKDIKDLDFSIEDLDSVQLEAKLFELYGEEVHKRLFSITYKEKYEALRKLFKLELIQDENGDIVGELDYYVEDFDDTYVFVRRQTWSQTGCETNYYKYTYSQNESDISLGEKTEVFLTWITEAQKQELANQTREFEEYKNDYSHSNEEYEKLLNFKEDKEKEENLRNLKVVLEKYAKALKTKDLEDLNKNIENYSTAELEKECLSFIGKYSLTGSFSMQKTEDNDNSFIAFDFSKIPNDNPEPEFKYEELFEKHLKRKGD